MTAPNIGYTSTRATDDIIPVTPPDFSGVGICTTAGGANPAFFPLDKAVRFRSTDILFLANAGTGYLADALRGMNAQLGGQGADTVAVVVADGTGADAATKLASAFANIIGNAGLMTGLWAVRNAVHTAKMAPRLLMVPGYTWQQPDGDNVDNPIRAELAAHTEAMKAIAVVDVDATSRVKAVAARERMSSDRLFPVGVAVRVYETVNGVSTLVTRPLSPRVIGRFVATDNAAGGKPFETVCNQPILGIVDINRPMSFDLGDGSTEGQTLLAADIGVVVTGEAANAGAIADGGFIFLGVESAGNNDLWSQIHQVRGADYIDVKMARITRQFLGPRITPRRVEAWLKSMQFMLLDHVRDEDILGYELNFPTEINSVEDIRLGELSIETKVEPSPAFRRAKNTIRRYRPAVQALIDAVFARAGSAQAVVS